MIDKFVVGFAFSEDLKYVLLIRKQRPDWQKGFLNGIGGKVEKGESSLDAMRRECKEETGLSLNWLRGGIIQGRHSAEEGYTADDGCAFQCYIFYAYSQDIFNFWQMEDEVLGIYSSCNLSQEKTIAYLNFLIPYGMCKNESNFISVYYQ